MSGVLTPRQTDALRAVQSLTAGQGYPPTVREVADVLGVSVSTAHDLLGHSVRAGALTRTSASMRTMVVTSLGLQLLNGGRR